MDESETRDGVQGGGTAMQREPKMASSEGQGQAGLGVYLGRGVPISSRFPGPEVCSVKPHPAWSGPEALSSQWMPQQ